MLSVCTVYQIDTCMNIVVKFVSDVPQEVSMEVHVIGYICSKVPVVHTAME